MADLRSLEDQAMLYVLGELTANERHEFEASMAQSTELRAVVRELEEGALALTITSPERRAPREVWAKIEKVVAGNAGQKVAAPAFWIVWWRYGWAAATACLVGWVLYAVWINRPATPVTSQATLEADFNPQREASRTISTPAKTENLSPQTLAALRMLQAGTQEIGALRWQIAGLTNRVADLSQELMRRQASLSEADRIKFFQLVSPAGGDAALTTAPVSPHLQRALFLAMARELGWLPPTASSPGESGSKQEQQGNSRSATLTNQTGVEFVDLRSPSNSVAQTASQSPPESIDAPQPSSLAASASSNVPGFISGTNAVLAFDTSVVPAGTSLGFWTATGDGQLYQFRGRAVLGNGPMVVTVPFSPIGGGAFAVTTWTTAGSSSTLWQFPPATSQSINP